MTPRREFHLLLLQKHTVLHLAIPTRLVVPWRQTPALELPTLVHALLSASLHFPFLLPAPIMPGHTSRAETQQLSSSQREETREVEHGWMDGWMGKAEECSPWCLNAALGFRLPRRVCVSAFNLDMDERSKGSSTA